MNQPKQKYILVAADEKNTLETLGFLLESANYEVDLFENGKDALVRILSLKDTNHPVNLLVTDLRMPVMSGAELVDALQRFNIHIPVLIITSYERTELKQKDYLSESIEYLTKPFGDDEFLTKIKELFVKTNEISHKYRFNM